MKSQDILNILVTFVVGTIVGAYLYIFGFSPQFSGVGDALQSSNEFRITGTAYGGCAFGGICGSFQIDAEGAFRMYPNALDKDAHILREGEVTETLWREVQRTFSATALEQLSRPIVPPSCVSESDGIDYDVRVYIGDAEYELDTCDTALVRSAAELALLRRLISDVGL